MLAFTELSEDGRGLEQLIRELALARDLTARWSGVGPDDGKDLILEERGDALFGSKIRRWLVSAKHFAHAREGVGRAVGIDDVGDSGGIVDAVDHHGATGYLLVCSTHASAGLMRRLDEIEEKRGVPIHVWDGVALQRLHASPRGWAVAQRFFPNSAQASGWQVFATESPNRFVGVTHGMYFRMSNRIGSKIGFQLSSIDMRLDRVQAIRLPAGHEIRLRGVFYDDKNGGFSTHWDYLWEGQHDPGSSSLANLSENALAEFIGDGTVTYDDGQFDDVTVVHHQVMRGQDHYDVDHYDFYAQLPAYW
jgi:hypothetical protein